LLLPEKGILFLKKDSFHFYSSDDDFVIAYIYISSVLFIDAAEGTVKIRWLIKEQD
jgi:hypothetical protein